MASFRQKTVCGRSQKPRFWSAGEGFGFEWWLWLVSFRSGGTAMFGVLGENPKVCFTGILSSKVSLRFSSNYSSGDRAGELYRGSPDISASSYKVNQILSFVRLHLQNSFLFGNHIASQQGILLPLNRKKLRSSGGTRIRAKLLSITKIESCCC